MEFIVPGISSPGTLDPERAAEGARSAVERAMDERLRKEREKIEADVMRAKGAIEESKRLKQEILGDVPFNDQHRKEAG